MKRIKPLTAKQLNTLVLVGTFGYLTTRELAMLNWAHITPKAALKAAQIATTQLRERGLLYPRPLPYNGITNAFVLTGKGASLLNDEFLQLSFTDGYDLEMNRLHMRTPVIELAHVYAREKGLGVVGARGLNREVFCMEGFKGLDAMLIDPDSLTPAFGILLVRHYDEATVKRVKAVSNLAVPVLLAASNEHLNRRDALIRVRAAVSPDHEEHLQHNKPQGITC